MEMGSREDFDRIRYRDISAAGLSCGTPPYEARRTIFKNAFSRNNIAGTGDRDAAGRAPSYLIVQALKSSSDTVGSFLTNATMVQNLLGRGPQWHQSSAFLFMLMPFLIAQNNCCGEVSLASSLRSGGARAQCLRRT